MSEEDLRGRLRRDGRAVRQALDGRARAAAVAELGRHVRSLGVVQRSTTLGLYVADDGEPDVASLAGERAVALPVPEPTGAGMHFAPWRAGATLVAGRFGIPVPPGDETVVPDVVLVPLVVADRHGNRLGRGKGFYDRWLSGHDVTAIGVAFECQMVDAVPAQGHDVTLAAVVTELGVRWPTPT